MTERKSLRRPRRTTSLATSIPPAVSAWFSGAGPLPWEALLPRECALMPDWWAAWLQLHPGAVPPADAPHHVKFNREAADVAAQRDNASTNGASTS